jgi:hypothetical protein
MWLHTREIVEEMHLEMGDNGTRMLVISRILFRAWLVIVSFSVILGLAFFVVPNEGLEHFGPRRLLSYVISLILAVAIVFLPLLIGAAVLDKVGKNRMTAAK